MNRNPEILGSGRVRTLLKPSARVAQAGRLAALSLAALGAAVILSVSGCGQKGPLYLPSPASAASTPSTP